MFEAKYTVSPKILHDIKQAALLIAELTNKVTPKPVLTTLQKDASTLSSHTSTSIEGNPLQLTDVKKILKNHSKHVRDSEREVINYNKALLYINDLIDSNKLIIDTPFILKIHGLVTHGLLPKIKRGKFRQEPVFVNDPRQKKTIYLPPDHQDVEPLIQDMIAYIHAHKDELDPQGLFISNLSLSILLLMGMEGQLV